jgi:hypothetical protein
VQPSGSSSTSCGSKDQQTRTCSKKLRRGRATLALERMRRRGLVKLVYYPDDLPRLTAEQQRALEAAHQRRPRAYAFWVLNM